MRALPDCRLISLCATFCLLLTAPPVAADGPDTPTAEQVTFFETHIRPLLIDKCHACHSSQDGVREGGLVLDHRDGWARGGERGRAIVPGDSESSLLIRAVRYQDPELQMPPDGRLTADEIAVLERWVRMGAPDPRTPSAGTATPGPAAADPVAGRAHWAFQPLRRPDLTASADDHWSRTAIDVLIHRRLATAGLAPAADADRRTLLHRLSFQLIGLPPTIEETDAFLNDRDDGALERVVDRLLDSPRFGERWGRHWLDLARYADSNGLDENFLFREAWRYRNWVIDSVNADMPFDEFAVQQLAGDLLPYETIAERDAQRIAAGFLVIGPKVLLGNDPQERVMDVADEQLDTIGRTFLGMTLGCARCHDHKFDPVPTEDYYALAGIFTSTSVMEQRYMLGQQRVMEQLVGLGEDGADRDDDYERYWRKDRAAIQQRLQGAQQALTLLQARDVPKLDELVASRPEVIAEGVRDADRDPAEGIALQEALVAELQRQIDEPPAIPPRGMIPADRDQPADEAIRLAGRFDRKGDVVPRGTLQVLDDGTFSVPPEQSGRLQLARWLTDTEHGAGHLTARVTANRIWSHLIGRGLVRTVDNFGRTGEAPSHPLLLDHLAASLIDSDWSVKSLIREIVLSRVFAIRSQHDAEGHERDPENTLLWRANRRRLEPEILRDTMLMAAGTLDLTPMDSTVWYLGDQATAVGANTNRRRTDFPCRSVYLPVIRNDLPEVFEAFDFADPHAATGERPRTMAATQALFLMNAESVMDAAQAAVRRVLGETSDREAAARLLLTRVLRSPPDEQDVTALLAFVDDIAADLPPGEAEDSAVTAWAVACQALFASSRFQFVE